MSDKELTNEQAEQLLWQFPCEFLFKAMTVAEKGVEDEIVAVIQRHAPGDYSPTVKASRNGNYFAVSVKLTAQSKQQLDQIYREVNALSRVKFCL